MFPVLQIGSLAVPVPGMALLMGVWVALWLAEKEATRLNLDPDAVYRLAFIGLVAGLIGSRLAYMARYWSAYAGDPLVLSQSTCLESVAPEKPALCRPSAASRFQKGAWFLH